MFSLVDEPWMSIHATWITPGEGLPRFRIRHLQDADDAAASGHGQGGQVSSGTWKPWTGAMAFHAFPMNIHER